MNKRSIATTAVLSALLTASLSIGNAQTNLATEDSRRDQANNSQSPILEGRVAVENGSAHVPDATVILECNGSERLRANAAADGHFTLMKEAVHTSISAESSRADGLSMSAATSCVLHADAAGYTSEQMYIPFDTAGVMEVGTIVLHPLNPALKEMQTVSVTSLAAPDKARKAFDKGQHEEKKHNWRSACEYFHRAVEIYPQYASAWQQLGRVQLQLRDLSGAQRSFQRVIGEDPHFFAGYLELAKVAAQQKDWNLVAGTTDHLAQLAPDVSPTLWFFNSVAKLNMGDTVMAERSVIRGLRLDVRHEVPQLEYLYGVVLAREGRYVQAAEHITIYLQRAPLAADLDKAKSELSRVKQLASQMPHDSAQ